VSTLASNHRLDGEMTSTDGVWPPWYRFAALLRLSTFNHFTVGIYCTAGCTLVTCRCLFVPLVGAQASTLASNHRLDGEMTSTDGVWLPWHRFAALLRLSTFNHFTVGIYCTAGCTLVTCRCLFVPLVGTQASTLASNHRLDGEMTSTDGVWLPWHRFAALLRFSTFNHFTVGIYCTAGCTLVTCRCLFVPLVGAQAST
jgi:hypothetical protein